MNIKQTLILSAATAGIALTVAGVAFARDAGPRQSRIDVLANILGVSPTELQSDLSPKKTLVQIAQEKGITQSDLQERMHALHRERMQERLNAMVKAGDITQVQADAQFAWQDKLQQWLTDNPAPLGETMGAKMMGKGTMGAGMLGVGGFGHHGAKGVGAPMGSMMR
ncbi:hypothetical protein HZA86_04185 [Candidatus Uhrbacteria bacterium]|nr:hypothetical protein [Candidatus Uhrbacteria bacterium]